jgi:hypothetical protein
MFCGGKLMSEVCNLDSPVAFKRPERGWTLKHVQNALERLKWWNAYLGEILAELGQLDIPGQTHRRVLAAETVKSDLLKDLAEFVETGHDALMRDMMVLFSADDGTPVALHSFRATLLDLNAGHVPNVGAAFVRLEIKVAGSCWQSSRGQE